MPEGPEIWRAAAQLAEVVEGAVIEEVWFGQRRLKHYNRTLSGERLLRVEARGKAILNHFDCGLSIYSHNQLYGVWKTAPRGRLPNTRRSLRLALHTENESALLYSASDIAVLDVDTLGAHPYLAKLGPEALDQTVTWRDIKARLLAPEFCRRSLAALYLDQHFVAGIGNYLRSEILHLARVHPTSRPCDLSQAELGRLARATLTLTRRSLSTGGVTNPPSRAKKLKQQGYRRSAYRFMAFDRSAEPCYTCGMSIERQTYSSRRLYLCPQCQPPCR